MSVKFDEVTHFNQLFIYEYSFWHFLKFMKLKKIGLMVIM